MHEKERYTETQIVWILREAEKGNAAAIIRREGIGESTFYKWKQKYGGIDVSDVRRLKELEAENSRLKKLVANLSLNIEMLREVNAKKW